MVTARHRNKSLREESRRRAGGRACELAGWQLEAKPVFVRTSQVQSNPPPLYSAPLSRLKKKKKTPLLYLDHNNISSLHLKFSTTLFMSSTRLLPLTPAFTYFLVMLESNRGARCVKRTFLCLSCIGSALDGRRRDAVVVARGFFSYVLNRGVATRGAHPVRRLAFF